MQKIAGITVSEPRGQAMLMLLSALRELKAGGTKKEVVGFIAESKWWKLVPEDRLPYPSQPSGAEPRWQTLIAWARKDCVENELMVKQERDYWQATTQGFNAVVRFRQAAGEAVLDVRQFYLWSGAFKKWFCPSYEVSDQDTPRPPDIYRDLLPPWLKSRKGNEVSRIVDQVVKKALAGDAESVRKVRDALTRKSTPDAGQGDRGGAA